MRLSKKIARNFVLPAALAFGIDKYFLGKSKTSCCILNFHGVRKNNNAVFNNRHMPVSEFEKVIVYIKKNFDIVPLSEIFEIHRAKRKVSRKTLALTFDDGYENNFNIALPVLKKHNVPATFYIISKSLVEDNYLAWPDMIDIIKKNHKEDIVVKNYVFKFPSFYNEALKLDLPAYLKTLGEHTETLASELLDRFGYKTKELNASPELLRLIKGKELANYANESLIEFGAHSHSHFNMEFLNKEAAVEEFKLSKELIEATIGKDVITFAFPDGSYSKETVELAKDQGYLNIAAVGYRHNENNSDPNLLARFTISNSTTYESNVLRLSKQFDLYGF
ncbi:hypothetical protein CNR22_05000 [Sphingobacteriaceae bacterium]|nr:hypothetical protein CNR22_05000 [Sphingobacteriaceae bacterium]